MGNNIRARRVSNPVLAQSVAFVCRKKTRSGGGGVFFFLPSERVLWARYIDRRVWLSPTVCVVLASLRSLNVGVGLLTYFRPCKKPARASHSTRYKLLTLTRDVIAYLIAQLPRNSASEGEIICTSWSVEKGEPEAPLDDVIVTGEGNVSLLSVMMYSTPLCK